jgi:valyl-tRNA synthetase
MNLDEGMTMADIDLSVTSDADKWILTRLNETIDHVTENMEKYEFAMVGNELYGFIWDDFCSWYVELSKSTLNGDDEALKKGTKSTLLVMLNAIIRLLHPFMPFVTEEIYLTMPHEKESICLETWPEKVTGYGEADMEGMSRLISMIQKIREVKTVNDMKPNAPLTCMVKDLDGNVVIPKESLKAMLQKMARTEWKESLEGDLAVETIHGGSLYIPSSELSDPAEELKKLEAEKKRLEGELKRSEHILSNPGFLNKAPEVKINSEKEKQAAYQKQYQVILDRIAQLQH